MKIIVSSTGILYYWYMSCVFCKIIEKKEPAKIAYEDENTIVFADIFPKAKIHLLICPRKHFIRLVDLPEKTIVDIMETAKKIARELKVTHNFKLVLHNGAQAGQIIDHLHFHFMSNERGAEVKYLS